MSKKMKKFTNGVVAQDRAREIIGALSGKKIYLPDVTSGYPASTLVGGKQSFSIDPLATGEGYPDVRSFKRKFGLFIPSTNTSMESELWSIIYKNQPALKGIGLHTTNVITPKPQVGDRAGVLQYRNDFLAGLKTATTQALQAEPEYLIMGMSMEHILDNLEEAKAPVDDVSKLSGNLGISAWHDAVSAGLKKFGAKKISVLTPFEATGNANALKFFQQLDFEVANIVGMGCGSAIDIGHVPDWAKEKIIKEELVYDAESGEKVDAIVQCGTNFSLSDVIEALEPEINVPILGINVTLLWHALRENGFSEPLVGGGRLLREY